MKIVIGMVALLLCYTIFAGISLDINYQESVDGKKIQLKKKIETYYGETQEFKIKGSKKILVVKVTDKIPEVLMNGEPDESLVLVDTKIIELIDGERRLIASPKIVTVLGSEAFMETYEDKERKVPTMTLKLLPKKL
jgi:hypothetical protein